MRPPKPISQTRFFVYAVGFHPYHASVVELQFEEAIVWTGSADEWKLTKGHKRGDVKPAKFGDGTCIVMGVQKFCELLCRVDDDTEYLLFDDQEQAWTVVNLINGVWTEDQELKELGQ